MKKSHVAAAMLAGAFALGASLIRARRRIAAPATPPAGGGLTILEFKPAMDDLMTMLIQPRHLKLYYAGEAKNWKLAEFQLRELRQALARIGRTIPTYRKIGVDDAVASIFTEKAVAVEGSDQGRRSRRSSRRPMRDMTTACNACHAGMEHEFLVIKVPQANVYPNQAFRPLPRCPARAFLVWKIPIEKSAPSWVRLFWCTDFSPALRGAFFLLEGFGDVRRLLRNALGVMGDHQPLAVLFLENIGHEVRSRREGADLWKRRTYLGAEHPSGVTIDANMRVERLDGNLGNDRLVRREFGPHGRPADHQLPVKRSDVDNVRIVSPEVLHGGEVKCRECGVKGLVRSKHRCILAGLGICRPRADLGESDCQASEPGSRDHRIIP